jgi:hypothetical protein
MLKRHRALVLAASLCVTVAGCSTPERVHGPNWAGPVETPGGHEFTPAQATARNVAGWVVLHCVIAEGQAARNCSVLAEMPEGWGFGQAALQTSGQTKIQNADSFAGAHVPAPGEGFNLPVVFCPPAQGPSCAAEAHAHIAAFVAQIPAINRLLQAHDCPAAAASAAATGVQPFTRLVAAACKRS